MRAPPLEWQGEARAQGSGGFACGQRGLVLVFVLVLAAWLSGCGGGGGETPAAGSPGAVGGPVGGPVGGAPPATLPPPVNVAEPAGRGRTLAVERLLRISAAEVREGLAARAGQAPPVQAAYDVIAWRITYLTLDADRREPGAAAVVDLLGAARRWRQRQGIAGNGQLFLGGYSEGGYTTMAAHRALETGTDPALAAPRAELVSVMPGAGPYHLAATLDALLEQIRDDNPLLAALIDPGFLRRLGSSVRAEVRRALNADVAFDTRFIDAYLEDDRDRIERQSNVHDWRPLRPLRLFHGGDDRTVPYVSSRSTLQAMLARAAPDVSLTDCRTAPAGHLECVPEYFAFLLAALAGQARDL